MREKRPISLEYIFMIKLFANVYDRHSWPNGCTKLADIFVGTCVGTPGVKYAKNLNILKFKTTRG